MTIKAGDLVMVVRPTPCCGNINGIGSVLTVSKITRQLGDCGFCGVTDERTSAFFEGHTGSVSASRLKKIDPPADGDSLPIRKELEVTA